MEIIFIMAKGPAIKFPRVEAGFYGITLNGEHVGYVKKEVDGKETSWYIFDNATEGMPADELTSDMAIDVPSELFREAKDEAISFYLNKLENAVAAAPAATEDEIADDTAGFDVDTLNLFEDDEADAEEEVEAEVDELALV